MRWLALGLLVGASCTPSEPRPAEPSASPTEAEAAPGRGADFVEAALVGQSYAMLRSLTEEAPARLSGSAAAERAVDWGLRTMRRIGLLNVRAEPVMVPKWERGGPERCEVLDVVGAAASRYDVLALGGSIPTPDQGVEGEVMMVRSFEELQKRADEARGKIVFFNRPMPRALMSTFMAYGQAVPQRTSGASEAAKVGGVFALVRSMTTKIDDHPHTGTMRYADGVDRIPTAAISTLDAEDLAERLSRNETVRLRLTMSCRSFEDVESANVVGEIVGSERPEEIVLVGGHLDSWDVGQGAHDDGAGCVHALEAARLILATGRRPKRTVRVVLFMNEENGLRGGRGYAAAHADERHVFAIESDRGGFVPRGFTCSAKGTLFDQIGAFADELDPFDMGALIPGGGGADIAPLRESGTVLLGLATISHRYFDYHHSATDVLENVNERELALGSAAMAHMASALSDS